MSTTHERLRFAFIFLLYVTAGVSTALLATKYETRDWHFWLVGIGAAASCGLAKLSPGSVADQK